jgi:phosphatidate cytidylyltransferase
VATDLKLRLASGLTAFLIVLPILTIGSFWWVVGLGAAAACWGLHEIVSMGMREQRASAYPLILVLGAGWFSVAAMSTSGGIPGVDEALPGLSDQLVVVAVASLVISATYFLVTAKTTDGLADRWAHFMLGLPYVAVPLGLFPALLQLEGGRAWLFAPLFAGWCGDIGGYFAGRAFGKRKMIPLISPKKTWAGFFGGVGLAVVGMLIFKFVFVDPLTDGPSTLTLLDCVVVGVIGDIAGVIGDLVASMIKRTHGVKDSGRFLPGHGGMLDRIDAVLFVVPVVYLWAAVVRPLIG